jgi:hypothetical protein
MVSQTENCATVILKPPKFDGIGIIISMFLIGSHANILHIPCGE